MFQRMSLVECHKPSDKLCRFPRLLFVRADLAIPPGFHLNKETLSTRAANHTSDIRGRYTYRLI